MSIPSTSQHQGRFIAVVGPSGAGKDSVMAGLCAARPDLHRVHRTITRPAQEGDAEDEPYEAVSDATFARRAERGDFILHWSAHGLRYGIPASVQSLIAGGQDVLANLSRGALTEAGERFETLVVLHVTAAPEILAKRLNARGREQGAALARRLSRSAPPLPKGLPIIEIDNSGTLQASVSDALAALYPERG
ncbi:phosphonate metabolism protein/1,5-bisphosphokinase (PRPP-forming) PhnN [Gymnodinialimonas ceratoperidinii]|uniref:Ribose 1,5-bisphosphate phosphokinase PhnN n=1 Tax=Gymnodinialimonas ceratoperidinii TaxID=2856823 RepID=A0A8F6TYC4_9RHOB|nr:phosphonate metabolism protein/1,5-bisphosphokinase (PRPP-forming) PhnN [Gymnodinialimonas ceratoperidinii]QXT41172.1 phosphonate metabolism protein/1,5-bisphosphokinase (PRPP-forming) PhnN [Gymnodinialimonas ceratoperidinii]